MPGPYTTTQEIWESLASRMKTEPGNLPPQWLRIVEEANQQAYQDILSALGGRGFSVADVDNWGSKRAYSLSIAIYWAFLYGAGAGGISAEALKELNLIPRLEKMAITNSSGVPITPSLLASPDSNRDGLTDTWGGAAIEGGRMNQDGFRINDRTVF